MAQKKNDREARVARERLRAYQARQAVHEKGRARRRRDNLIGGIGLVVVAAIAVVLQLTYFGAGPGKPKTVPTQSPVPSASATPSPTTSGDVPPSTLAEGRDWTGTLTLNKDVKLGVTIDGKDAPQAASAVVDLVQKKWYDGTVCHRLTTADGFKVLQCGGAKTVADGPTGGPGFSYGPIENAPKATDGSITSDSPNGSSVYPAGTIAMARQGDNANSNGSQFFIVYGDTTIPNDSAGGYTVVGTITSGLDKLVSEIASKGETPSDPSSPDDGVPKVATTITGFTLK